MENWIKVQCQTRDENGLRGQQKRKQNLKKTLLGTLVIRKGWLAESLKVVFILILFQPQPSALPGFFFSCEASTSRGEVSSFRVTHKQTKGCIPREVKIVFHQSGSVFNRWILFSFVYNLEKFVAETELDLDGKGGCGGGNCHKNCIATSCTHVESLKVSCGHCHKGHVRKEC